MRKIQIAISSDLCIRLTWNLTGSCGQQKRLRRWSRMVVKQFQDGGRPPFLKSIYRHISVKNHPILMKFCTHSSTFWTGWTSRDQKRKVALDRLRVRQNVFSCWISLSLSGTVERNRCNSQASRSNYRGYLRVLRYLLFIIIIILTQKGVCRRGLQTFKRDIFAKLLRLEVCKPPRLYHSFLANRLSI